MSASESAKQSYILTEQRCSELQQRKNQSAQRSDVVNSKAATCFSYIPTMLTNALPGTHWIRDMGTWQQALAQWWSPLPVLSILMIFHPLKDSMLIRTFRMLWLPVPFKVGELWTVMCVNCKSMDKPVRQARKPSEGFELTYSYHAQESY